MSASLKRRAHDQIVGTNYWPGYADALTNLVLNLLFFIALLALMIATFGVAVSQKLRGQRFTDPAAPLAVTARRPVAVKSTVDVPLEASSPAALNARPAGQPLPPSALPPVKPLVITANQGHAEVAVTGPAIVSSVRRIGNRTLFGLTYQDDVIAPDEKSRQAILARFDHEAGPAGPGDLSIWSIADAANMRQSRTAFLRIAKWRDVLIAHGVPQASIHTRIVRGFDRPDQIGTVFIGITPPQSNQ